MSFFKKIGAWFAKTFGGTNSTVVVNDLHTAASAIQLLAPGLVLAIQSAGATEQSTEVQAVANEVITDLGVLSQLLAKAQTGDTSAKAQVISTLEGIKSSLQDLLAAGHIKNAETVAKITNVTNAFIAEAEVIIGMLK